MSNLEEEITQELATQMQSEMDFHILSDMLVKSCGWRKVVLTRFFSRKHSVNILMWCEENIKNPFEHRGSTFVFENEGDAVNFTLRWQ
jgi:hypothetical protein